LKKLALAAQKIVLHCTNNGNPSNLE